MVRIILLSAIALPFSVRAEETKTLPKPLSAPFTQADVHKARKEWAQHLNIPERKELDLGKGVKLEVVLIPPGKFRMGSPASEREFIQKQFNAVIQGENERDVRISKPFYLAVTETTQEQYEAVLGWARNISWFNSTGRGKERVKGIDCDQIPAERVTWNDANDFCEELNEELGGKQKARLPTEAEWEYACRAGTTTAFHFGSKLNGREVNCAGDTIPYGTDEKGPFLQRTTKVKSYPSNAFGLFDMHGNVAEWCLDYYAEDARGLPAIDPFRSTKVGKSLRVIRGGSWDLPAFRCRSAERGFAAPDRRDNAFGFRICVPVER